MRQLWMHHSPLLFPLLHFCVRRFFGFPVREPLLYPQYWTTPGTCCSSPLPYWEGQKVCNAPFGMKKKGVWARTRLIKRDICWPKNGDQKRRIIAILNSEKPKRDNLWTLLLSDDEKRLYASVIDTQSRTVLVLRVLRAEGEHVDVDLDNGRLRKTYFVTA